MKLVKVLLFGFTVALTSCSEDDSEGGALGDSSKYKTENVIVLVVDGPRYSETWGDTTHQYQPNLANHLAKEGVIYSNFFNNGVTYTNPGHTAITTGNYQAINNSGTELPDNPSFFQEWLKQKNEDSLNAWIVASKDKLAILANTTDSVWSNQYMASTNCGIGGLGVGHGYRADSLTFDSVKSILVKFHPNLMLINFRQPDYAGHGNKWGKYLQGIVDTDEYTYQIWNYLQSDPVYANKTSLFVTNDHGRHLDSVKNGFVSHGDDCEGCRHINLFAVGPDFKKNVISNTTREQIDISATIAELLQFNMTEGKGTVMTELFEN